MTWKLSKALRRFRRSEDGAATVEFCILFPAFIAIFLASIESGIMMVRNVMLERGADIAIRNLRLGNPIDPTMTPEERYKLVKTTVCQNALIFPNCEKLVQINLEPVDMGSITPISAPMNCINEKTHNAAVSPINPFNSTTYVGGLNNEIMIVRICALFEPIFPTTTLGMKMPRYDPDPNDDFDTTKYALVVTSAFVNEPSR